GLVENVEEMRIIKQGLDEIMKENPNLATMASKGVWRSYLAENVADPIPRIAVTQGQRARVERMKRRAELRIGIPRVLNMYSLNPLFATYFESLGVSPNNIVYSDFTSEELYKAGAKRGSIDPCFPSKVAIPHIHNLLYVKHRKRPLDLIFFPMIDCLPSPLSKTLASRACPTVTTTPESVKAAFTKEGDLFAEMGVRFLDTFLNISEERLFEKQMFEQFKDILGLSEAENRRAVAAGYRALAHFDRNVMRAAGRQVIEMLEREDRIAIVLLGRPYHNDPGINHEILEELQKCGYPILAQDALPLDPDLLERLFGEEVRRGIIADPMDISDAWKNAY
ncbi:MAG: CoA activase, partial [Deltaproteobacteria bacterium]